MANVTYIGVARSGYDENFAFLELTRPIAYDSDAAKIRLMASAMRTLCITPHEPRARAQIYRDLGLSWQDAERLDVAALRALHKIIEEE